MRTPKQIAARANGAKSKSPVTAQGKRNSSRNSLRHGIFADTIVLEVEQRDAFLEMVNELWDEHQPQTPTEKMLVDTIVGASWRQQRIWGIQKVALDYVRNPPPAGASELNPLRAVLSLRASPESVRTHEHLLRSEIAADRQISRALHRLLLLRENRSGDSIRKLALRYEPSNSLKRHVRLSPIPTLSRCQGYHENGSRERMLNSRQFKIRCDARSVSGPQWFMKTGTDLGCLKNLLHSFGPTRQAVVYSKMAGV